MTKIKAFFICFFSPIIVAISWYFLDMFYPTDAYVNGVTPAVEYFSMALALVFLASFFIFILRLVHHRFRSIAITIVSVLLLIALFLTITFFVFVANYYGALFFYPGLINILFIFSFFVPILKVYKKYGKEFLKPCTLGLISITVLFLILWGFSQSVYDFVDYNIIL